LKPYDSLDKNLWALSRYGISPGKLWQRFSRQPGPKIFSNSVPKSGTHLLERVLCLHPRLYRHWMPTIHEVNVKKPGLKRLLAGLAPGEIMLSHLLYAPEREDLLRQMGVRPLFLIRDPRDVVISQAYYIGHKPDHPQYDTEYLNRFQNILSGVDIAPDRKRRAFKERLEGFAGWLDSDSLIVRFEDLVGAQGGGDAAIQLQTLRAIFDFIELEVSDDWLPTLSGQLFSDSSPTSRKGAIGQWRDQFTPEIKTLFKQATGDMLIRYGYEQDYDW